MISPDEPWDLEMVDDGGSNDDSVGINPSIAVDSADTIDISYYDYSNHRIKYAKGSLAKWEKINVDDTTFGSGMYSSLVVDRRNRVYICYYGDAGKLLFKAVLNGEVNNLSFDYVAE